MMINHPNSKLLNTTEDEILVIEEDDIILLEDDIQLDNTDREISETLQESTAPGSWQVLVVDDEPDVYQATQIALKDFRFEGKPLTLLYAGSGADARKVLDQYPDICFILLDVVMETNNAGLEVVRYIRDVLKNKRVQIILRTGQPGEAPEMSLIQEYEINDYKLKTELTRQRLITTVVTSLRSYCNVVAAEEKTVELAQAFTLLQKTQLQLIQSEKMAILGNLVAGVAHEINNPVGFINGNIKAAQDHLRDLLEGFSLYRDHASIPDAVREDLEDLDLGFVLDDFPKLMASMQKGCDRIRNISTSLRTFSRTDTDRKTEFNLHDGLDSTLLILKYRLKANEARPAIEIIKRYGEIPAVNCYAGQLNQVFMNVLANAIDALEESNAGKTLQQIKQAPNRIMISTTVSADQQQVMVTIGDNGPGMSEAVKAKIFDQGFTTKGVGKGTGLGMAIAHQIITETHAGKLTVHSEMGQGTEFCIHLPI